MEAQAPKKKNWLFVRAKELGYYGTPGQRRKEGSEFYVEAKHYSPTWMQILKQKVSPSVEQELADAKAGKFKRPKKGMAALARKSQAAVEVAAPVTSQEREELERLRHENEMLLAQVTAVQASAPAEDEPSAEVEHPDNAEELPPDEGESVI